MTKPLNLLQAGETLGGPLQHAFLALHQHLRHCLCDPWRWESADNSKDMHAPRWSWSTTLIRSDQGIYHTAARTTSRDVVLVSECALGLRIRVASGIAVVRV